ncbi:MAG: hypothetical protein IPK79_08395 [Vampirovibrionales bacterium]|nr:hypothetical protein [Vampirovibrionales bacterium]
MTMLPVSFRPALRFGATETTPTRDHTPQRGPTPTPQTSARPDFPKADNLVKTLLYLFRKFHEYPRSIKLIQGWNPFQSCDRQGVLDLLNAYNQHQPLPHAFTVSAHNSNTFIANLQDGRQIRLRIIPDPDTLHNKVIGPHLFLCLTTPVSQIEPNGRTCMELKMQLPIKGGSFLEHREKEVLKLALRKAKINRAAGIAPEA